MLRNIIVACTLICWSSLSSASFPLAAPAANVTCQKGLYKCAERDKDAVEYWSCIRYECKAEDAQTAKPDCEIGITMCQIPLQKYDSCIRAVCGGIDTSCAAAETRCGVAANSFHQCTKRACLGPLLASYKAMEEAEQQEIARFRARSQEAMRAFDPAESPAYRNRTAGGLPSRFLICPGSGTKYCPGNDSRACICTNGKPPINALEQPTARIINLIAPLNQSAISR